MSRESSSYSLLWIGFGPALKVSYSSVPTEDYLTPSFDRNHGDTDK